MSEYPTQPAVPETGLPSDLAPAASPVSSAMLAAVVAVASLLAFGLCLVFLMALGNVSGGGRSSTPKDQAVLFFTATWCPACQHMEPVVSDLQGRGCNIRKVDIDSETSLAERYGVHRIPTFVLLENGYETNRRVGGMDGEVLAGWLHK